MDGGLRSKRQGTSRGITVDGHWGVQPEQTAIVLIVRKLYIEELRYIQQASNSVHDRDKNIADHASHYPMRPLS